MKILLLILILFNTVCFSQTYKLRTIAVSATSDSLYLKIDALGVSTDSLYRLIDGSYIFAMTPKIKTFFPFEQLSGKPTSLSGYGIIDAMPAATLQTALNLKANTSALLGYTIDVQALTSSPTDAQTIYFGQLPKAPVTAAATSKIYIRKAGTIKMANIYCYSGTAGTAEAWVMSIRLNNTTDTQIASVAAAINERVFSNSSLNIPVIAGDYIEIKAVNPTWATNPLTTIFGGYIYIE